MRGVFIVVILMFVCSIRALTQCTGIPSISSLGSNKIPVGLCAPVQANLTYNITFTSPASAGQLELIYDWGDGSAMESVLLTPGGTTYQTARVHTFPAESDCEYFVTMTIRYNGKFCTSTRQIQKIASWRTDNQNGGVIKMVSPVTGTTEHRVCEGEDIDVIFKDETQWNCNSQYIEQPPNPIESPNTEYRWQQIVYNTSVSGKKIPNVSIDGVPVTGATGTDLIGGYQDPRGVFYMAGPVVLNDGRRRPSLRISAPGGFGTGHPKGGDVFEIKLRYWNFCNPYDDPAIPGPPADLINGDHPPVEKIASIKIIAAPIAPVATNQTVCNGTAPAAFVVSGIPANNIVTWHENIPEPDRPGKVILSGTATSLAVSAHPEWIDKSKPSVLKVWVSHRAKGTGTNCESPKVLLTRTIRENLIIADPLTALPTDLCNNNAFTITLPPAATETIGGATHYTWMGSEDLTLISSTSASATFSANIPDFGSAPYADRTVTITRQYSSNPGCAKSRSFNVRIYRRTVGGTLSSSQDICETAAANTFTLSGYVGKILQWEIKKNNGAYTIYAGAREGDSIMPGLLAPGIYAFRALVQNGICEKAYSTEETFEVYTSPQHAYAGEDQFICTSLSSVALKASNPSPGIGTWSYVSSIPQGLPAPDFTTNANDPHTAITISAASAGAYTMRWTVSNGACKTADEVVVDFGTDPSEPHAGNAEIVCGATTALGANTPLKGSGSWSVVDGPGCAGDECPITITSPSSPVSEVTLDGPSFAYGIYTLRWSITSGGNNCFLKMDEVSIRFDEPVDVDASDIHEVCLDIDNLSSIKLSGTATGPFKNAKWANVSGYGTVSASKKNSASVEADYFPSIDDYQRGVPIKVKLIAEPIVQDACLPIEKIISIIIDRKPTAIAGPAIDNICEDAVALKAEPPLFEATGRWTTTAPGVTFDNPAHPRTTIRNLPPAPSVVVATWTVTSASGKCISNPSSVTLNRVVLPDAVDYRAVVCEANDGLGSISLLDYEDSITSLPAANRAIKWYKYVASTAATVAIDETQLQNNVLDGQVYIANIRDTRTACTSEARLIVNVRTLPAVMNGLLTFCEDIPGSKMVSEIDVNAPEFQSAVTKETNVKVMWYRSIDDANNNHDPIIMPLSVAGGKEVYARVTYNDWPECFSMAKLNMVVNERPGVTAIAGRESVCQGVDDDLRVEVYQVPLVTGAKYRWSVPDDPDTEFKVFAGGKESDFYLLLQFPNQYDGKISVSTVLNGCESPIIEKSIHVSATPAKPVITGPDIACSNSAGVVYSLSPDNYPSSTYNWEIRSASGEQVEDTYIVEGQSTGRVLLNFGEEDVVLTAREVNAVCAGPLAVYAIEIAESPKTGLSIEKDITCSSGVDGAIRTHVSGGTTPYEKYTILQTGKTDADNDGIFTELSEGSYTVRVKDANGCEATSNTQVLMPPSQVVIDKVEVMTDNNGHHLSCRNASDGAITVYFSGGNSNAEYTVALTKSDATKELSLKGKGHLTFTGLSAGTYSIAVTDSNGCTAQPGIALITNPPPFYGGIIGSHQSICAGDDPAPLVELAPASGGVSNFTYEWQESSTGNVNNDAEWITISGANGISYDPPVLNAVQGTQRHYRRLVRSISLLQGVPAYCEVKGKTEKITITINPIPEVTFTANAASICEGDILALTLNLTTGTPPVIYDYSSSDQTFTNQEGAKNTVITVNDFQKENIYTLLRLVDANGCVAQHLPEAIHADVISVKPEFTIAGSDAKCNGGEFTFSWTAEAGIDYRWEWADGTNTVFKSGAIAVGKHEITHRFLSGSSQEATLYPVRLFASNPGCREKYVSHPVVVYPSMRLNIMAEDTAVCSGATVTFHDNSDGVDKGRWYYRELGSTIILEERPAQRTVSFSINNTTEKNPVVYEMVYEAFNNEGCSAVYRKQIKVYRHNVAGIAIDNIMPFEKEKAEVTMRNTSAVVDNNAFQYLWHFGANGVLSEDGGNGSLAVHYLSPGIKTVSLTAVNIEAMNNGETCQSFTTRQITVPVLTLDADFTATPMASCFPADISITNTSVGADIFQWSVYHGNDLVTTSNLKDPVFRISSPGSYDIYLVVTNSVSGLSAKTELKGVEILDIPKAAFEVRSKTLFVPDTELQIVNFSTGANEYAWSFGDGGVSTDVEPVYQYKVEGRYRVRLKAGIDYGMKDADGDGLVDDHLVCYDSSWQEVIAVQGGTVKIPNAFTPGIAGPTSGRTARSGFNDIFLPVVEGTTAFKMQIFDRWGTLVFESNDKDTGWDGYNRSGQPMSAGVYVYKIIARLSNGKQETRVGDVTLIR